MLEADHKWHSAVINLIPAIPSCLTISTTTLKFAKTRTKLMEYRPTYRMYCL